MEKLAEMAEKIARIRKTATELKEASEGFPALSRNAARILASVRMLEINLTDALDPVHPTS